MKSLKLQSLLLIVFTVTLLCACTKTNINDQEQKAVLAFNESVSARTNQLVSIDFETKTEQSITFDVYDITGRIVEQHEILADAGLQTLELNTTLYPEGTYFVSIPTNNGTVTSKFDVE